MDLQDALRGATAATGQVLDVTLPVIADEGFALEGVELRYSSPEACLTLRGAGPFRFVDCRFTHEGSEAPTLVVLDGARAEFVGCRFVGANGGTEEALACAVALQGASDAVLRDCAFEDNDLHLEASGESSLRVLGTQMAAARADAVRLGDTVRATFSSCELVESGWSGLVLSGSAVADVGGSRLSGNGCHGVAAGDSARLQCSGNSFTGNRQHGVLLTGKAVFASREDHLAANDLCGLDGSESSQCLLVETESYGNESHGLQLRGQAGAVLRGCRLGDNEGSGLALFDETQASAFRLVAEANSLNGVQSAGASRLNLDSSEVLGNYSSGLACFGTSRSTVEGCTLGGSQGYAVQMSEECRLMMSACQLSDNRKGGLLLANEALAMVDGTTVNDNGLHGVAVSDNAQLTLQSCEVRSNARDGVLLLGEGPYQVTRCQLLSNGRHGLFAVSARPVLSDNVARENVIEQVLVENARAMSMERAPSLEEPAGVTLTTETGQTMHLPFQPKPIEESMLMALLRHGRLTEAALGRAAKSRRVGGAMENLIDRLNKAGMPVLRHEGDGPEGNVYALKLDTSRVRQVPGSRATDAVVMNAAEAV